MANEFLNKKELLVFVKELKYWLKPENFPPEFQPNNIKPNITPLADIWCLGTLVRELVNMGSLCASPVSYSKKLLDLQATMLRTQPQQRPTPDHILNHVAAKETASVRANVVIEPVPKVNVEYSEIKYCQLLTLVGN